MLDESQFLPVRAAGDHPIPQANPEMHNHNLGTAYPQLWGGTYDHNPYIPVAQQVCYSSSQQSWSLHDPFCGSAAALSPFCGSAAV